MLQKTPQYVVNRHALADYLETLSPSKFNMADWRTCICGHCISYFGIENEFPLHWPLTLDEIASRKAAAEKILGLSRDDAAHLFCGAGKMNAKQAAAKLRGLP